MKIGVIGAGTMGAGIAQVFAQGGYHVFLCDITDEFAQKGFEQIKKSVQRMVQRGKIEQAEAEQLLERFTVTADLTKLQDCDYVIEAVKEDLQVKHTLFCQLMQICPPKTVFLSNTSSLSLTAMANGLDRPVVGMHFFNPVPVMKLVEVIAGLQVTPQLVQQVCDLAKAIGKTPVQVKEYAGFVVNRLLVPMINEAIAIYAEGIASAEEIDQAMQLGANHPIGPLALSDLIGNDVVLAIMQTLQTELGDAKYHPHPLLKQMVGAGRLGRKTKQGFFHYD